MRNQLVVLEHPFGEYWGHGGPRKYRTLSWWLNGVHIQYLREGGGPDYHWGEYFDRRAREITEELETAAMVGAMRARLK